MDFPFHKKSRGLICIHFFNLFENFLFVRYYKIGAAREMGGSKKVFFLWYWMLLLTFLFKPLSFGVDLIERCFSLKNLQSAIYLCKGGLQRSDCNKPKRYHPINNHTNNNHHEDVNTTFQGGPKRPDRRQVESHVRSSRSWRTPARDWSRRPRSSS